MTNEIGILSKEEELEERLEEEGIIGYAETVIEMIQDIYGIDLEEMEEN